MTPEGSWPKVGATLPHFGSDADAVVRFGRASEQAGLDGVFAFDHLWPPGEPGADALACFPTLSAVVASTTRLCVGSLVARVSLLAPEVLVASARALQRASGGRMVAGVGLGDRVSAPEERAFGLDDIGDAERLGRLEAVLGGLRAEGVPTWVGIGAPSGAPSARLRTVLELAERHQATICSWAARTLVGLRSGLGPGPVLAWAGPTPKPASDLAPFLDEATQARVDWVVFGWPDDVGALGRAVGRWRAEQFERKRLAE